MKVSAITAQVLLNNEADVIFGPLCNDETVTVADLAANLRVPMFASFGTDVDLLNKKRFKLTCGCRTLRGRFKTQPPVARGPAVTGGCLTVDFVREIFRKFEWRCYYVRRH